MKEFVFKEEVGDVRKIVDLLMLFFVVCCIR